MCLIQVFSIFSILGIDLNLKMESPNVDFDSSVNIVLSGECLSPDPVEPVGCLSRHVQLTTISEICASLGAQQ